MRKYLGLVCALVIAWTGSAGAEDKKADPKPGASALSEHLKDYEPVLGGVWVTEGKNAEGQAYTIRLTFRPMLNKQFVLVMMEAVVDGNVVSQSASMTGWDAKAKALKSWQYSSNGTFRRATITPRKDGRYHEVVDSKGGKSSSLHKNTFTGEDTWELAITDRKRDGEALPDQKYILKRHKKVEELPTKFGDEPAHVAHFKPWGPRVGGTWESVEGEPTTPEGKKIKGTVATRLILNKNFLIDHLKLTVDGEALMEEITVIGWDPEARVLRARSFVSDGSMGQGTITAKEGGKLVFVGEDSNGVKRTGTAQNTFPDKDTWIYQITERTEDGKEMPDMKITVKRKKE